MNKIILPIILLLSVSANAGRAKLNFTHNNLGVDGSTITLTAFNVYWGIQGQPVNMVVPLGPPAPLPWKVDAGVYYYSKTLDDATWTPGTTVCFQMTAFAKDLESGRSNQVCKKMPSDPSKPVIVNIDNP